MSQDKRNDLAATDSGSDTAPVESAPKPNQSNYSKDLLKYYWSKDFEGSYPTRLTDEQRGELDELQALINKERSRLIDELEAALPEKHDVNPGTTGYKTAAGFSYSEGYNSAITEVKAILEEAKNVH